MNPKTFACFVTVLFGSHFAKAHTNAHIPWDQIGARAGADYKGDGLIVTPTTFGARLHCSFQRLDGEATREGLWLTSTATEQLKDPFRVKAVAVGRQGVPTERAREVTTLLANGEVSVDGQTVRFIRSSLVEEYSVTMDGVRQDFVVLKKPGSRLAGSLVRSTEGELRLELAVSGARVEPTSHGAQLVLEHSGRKIVYSRLKATDANGRELPARIEPTSKSKIDNLKSEMTLAVVVNDADAVYPLRIDPTFSDANWVSMGGVPGASGGVMAAVVDDSGNLYIGGGFGMIGEVVVNFIAKWDGTGWSSLGSGLSDPVLALAVSGSDLYAGGWFSGAIDSGGEFSLLNHVAKWNGSSWSALGSGLASNVNALAVFGGDLYAGGLFLTFDGQGPNSIAKWDGSTWSTLRPAVDGPVSALAASGSGLYVGGWFGSAGDVAASGIARWDGNNWSALGSSVDGPVLALAVSGSDLYVGGLFASAGGVAASNIAKWSRNNWSALGSGIDGGVYALAISGGDLYAGGSFTNAGGMLATNVAKWNGSSWSALGRGVGGPPGYPPYAGTVDALAVLGNELYAGGYLRVEGDSPAYNIARWDGTNWSVPNGTAMSFGIDDSGAFGVYSLAASGNELYAGGNFTMTAEGDSLYGVAKWDGKAWKALGLGVDYQDPVYALAVSGSDLYVGGYFGVAGEILASSIAKWNGSSWSALGSGVSGSADPRYGGVGLVYALAVSGSNVFAGGDFSSADGVAANNIARWNGSSWSALGSGVRSVYNSGGVVHALAVAGEDLYAGGRFTNAGGIFANGVAKWNGSSWSAVGSGIGSPRYGDYGPEVYALAVAGKDLYVGGRFTNAGSILANGIAKWNGSSWSALGSGVNDAVFALAVSGGELYAGGEFTTAGGVLANNIAKWNGSNWIALGSGADSFVFALEPSGNDVYAGGWLRRAGGKGSSYVAKWAPLGFRKDSVAVSGGKFQALLTGPDKNSVVVDRTTTFNDWTPVATNTLPPGGAWPLSLPIGTNIHQAYRARLLP